MQKYPTFVEYALKRMMKVVVILSAGSNVHNVTCGSMKHALVITHKQQILISSVHIVYNSVISISRHNHVYVNNDISINFHSTLYYHVYVNNDMS